MAELQLGPLADDCLGYAGLSGTIFEALRFLNRLKPVDLSKIPAEDQVCAICHNCLSDPEADQTWHQLVQLPGCGHFFGRSCLISWLTPLDKVGDAVDGEFGDEDEEEEMIEDSGSVTGQPAVGATEVGSLSRPRWTPISENHDLSGTSPSVDGLNMSSRLNASSEALRASVDNYPGQDENTRGVTVEGMEGAGEEDQVHNESSIEPNEDNTPHIARQQQSYDIDPPSTPTSSTTAHFAGTASLARDTLSGAPSDLVEDTENFVYRVLIPGNNTCPLCRAQVFPKPAYGDSVHFLRISVRAWDLAYKHTGIERNYLDDVYRSACLTFIHSWDVMRKAMGEGVERIANVERPRVFSHAAASLVAATREPEYYSFWRWTNKQRRALRDFGHYMKFREEDVPIWFGTDPRLDDVRLIHVWTGPDRTSRRGKGSGRVWVQVRIKDHPDDFRLGSEDEDIPCSEDEETEAESLVDEDDPMVIEDILDEDGDVVVEDYLDDPSLTPSESRDSSSGEDEDETQASEISERDEDDSMDEDLDEVT
ncbi:MAG: hypothetical protein Q9225_003122 [Loekoesia sp. 1 TL-2023]